MLNENGFLTQKVAMLRLLANQMSRRGFLLAAVCGACLAVGHPAAQAQDLTVAAASDLQSVFPTLAERFERETGHAVKVTFGSSGNFFTQIQNGAPFDLFFSADIEYPRQLEAGGQAEAGTLHEYAQGQLVLWTRKSTGIDVSRGLRVLTDSRVTNVAIANPEHAPYGRAAVAALQHEQLYDSVRAKLVLGENISQAAQFAQSGNAEVGILALSLAVAPALRESGVYVVVPSSFYPPIEQAAVVLSASHNKDLARQLIAFLGRPEIARLMQDSGFLPPQPVTTPR
jgi:molybdate transport system substrate-binding protein